MFHLLIFTRFLIKPFKEGIGRIIIPGNDRAKPLRSLAFVEYYTTTEVAYYLGLTYEEFFDLPTKDPNKLKTIFDLGEIVHRLINSDFYDRVAQN